MDERIEQENQAQLLRQRMTRGTVGNAFQRAVELVIGLLLVPVTLKLLGEEAYGYWALIFAVANYISLSDLGFTAALNHFFVTALAKEGPRERRALFSSAFAYLFVVGLAVFLLCLAAEPLVLKAFPGTAQFGMAAHWAWRGTVFVLGLSFLHSFGKSLFIATHRVALLSLVSTLLYSLYSVSILAALLAGWGLYGMAAVSAAMAVVRLFVLMPIGVRGVEDFTINPALVERGLIAKLWRFGLRVFTARMAEVIYVNFDRILLGRVLGVGAVTPYHVGAKAAGSAANLPTVMQSVIEPEAARFQALGERDKLRLLLSRSTRYTAMIGMGVAGVLVILAPEVIALWIGGMATPRMVLSLRILAVAHISMSLTAPIRSIARGMGYPGWEATASILQALANIVLSILFYAKFGFTGVLFGTLFAVVIGQGYFLVSALRKLGSKCGQFLAGSWLGPLLTTLVASIAVYQTKVLTPIRLDSYSRSEAILPLLLLSLVYGAVFVAIALLTRTTSVSEIGMLLRSIRGRSKR